MIRRLNLTLPLAMCLFLLAGCQHDRHMGAKPMDGDCCDAGCPMPDKSHDKMHDHVGGKHAGHDAGSQEHATAAKHVAFTPESMAWVDGPPALPAGAKVVALEGAPDKAGPFTLRVKLPAGYRIQPHTHPADERVTVLQGALIFGGGPVFDQSKKTLTVTAGSFSIMPAGMQHFAWTEQETIFQLHGIGPWGITYVNPADDPRNKK